MPPKKDQGKPAQVKGDEAADLILDYLRKQNRPYSATDVSANLHNAVTKTNAVKVLKDLSERGELECKTSGKQAVYHIRQDPSDFASPEELVEINSEVEGLKNDVANLKSEHKSLSQSVQQLRSIPNADELENLVSNLEEENKKLRGRLEILTSDNIEPVAPDEKQKVDRELNTSLAIMNRRQKAFKNFWDEVKYNLSGGGKPSDLWDELGFESPPKMTT